MPTIQDFKKEILRIAKANIGDKSWGYLFSRQAKRNSNVKFGICEWKCNLFVYEILLASLIDIGTPNRISDKRWILKLEGKNDRPPTAMQWYKGEVPHFKEIKREEASGGDICSDGSHCGIVSDSSKTTISAAQDEVVSNDWGWREGQNNVKFFTLNETP